MAGVDKATKRAVALIVLLILAAAALRGYLPGGGENIARKPQTSSPAALVADVALLSVSMAIVAVAIIAHLRNRRAAPPHTSEVSERFRGGGGRPTWRFWLIALGVMVVWLLIVLLLARLLPGQAIDQPMSGTGSSPATRANGTAPPPPPPPPRDDGDVLPYLAATTMAFLVLLGTAAVIAVARRRRVTQPHEIAPYPFEAPIPATQTESLARAAELGLAEIGDLSREPREAIIACYAVMERELAKVPAAIPQDFDTPTEVLARAVEHHALHADSATELVELFEEARFSPHVMTEKHREVAVRVLRRVLTEMRSAA
jgi:hypothetical protein